MKLRRVVWLGVGIDFHPDGLHGASSAGVAPGRAADLFADSLNNLKIRIVTETDALLSYFHPRNATFKVGDNCPRSSETGRESLFAFFGAHRCRHGGEIIGGTPFRGIDKENT